MFWISDAMSPVTCTGSNFKNIIKDNIEIMNKYVKWQTAAGRYQALIIDS